MSLYELKTGFAVKAREMFLFFHIGFSLKRADVVLVILESISDLDPSVEMAGHRSSSPVLAFDLLS